MRSEVGEAELNYEYPRFPISTSAPRLSYLAPKHVKETLYVKTSLKEINGEKILNDLNISPNLRPENLSVIDFCKIAEKSLH